MNDLSLQCQLRKSPAFTIAVITLALDRENTTIFSLVSIFLRGLLFAEPSRAVHVHGDKSRNLVDIAIPRRASTP
jgi:hypothetical protein